VWSYYVIVSYRLYVPQVFFSFFLYYSRSTAGMLLIVCKGFVTRLTRRVPLVEQELLTLPEHQSSPAVFSGVRVTRYLVLCVCFVDRCLSFCTFSFGHCVVCSSSMYGFWLPLWYLQALLHRMFPFDYPRLKKETTDYIANGMNITFESTGLRLRPYVFSNDFNIQAT
jgi:hypothetical protein